MVMATEEMTMLVMVLDMVILGTMDMAEEIMEQGITDMAPMKNLEMKNMVELVQVEEDMAKDMAEAESVMVKSKYTVEDYAIAFVNGMSTSQRNRFKQMLEHGIKCGECIAVNYGIDYNDLMNEVKRILNVEVADG